MRFFGQKNSSLENCASTIDISDISLILKNETIYATVQIIKHYHQVK